MDELRAVLFDFDGVVNKAPEKFDAIFRRDFSSDSHIMNFFDDGTYSDCRLGINSLLEELEKYTRGTSWTPMSLIDYWHKCDMVLDKDVLGLVSRLRDRGVKTFIATNQAEERTKYMREVVGLDKYFDRIISSSDLSAVKPEPSFYRMAEVLIERHYNLLPKNFVFLDDIVENVVAAKRYGWENSFLYKKIDDAFEVLDSYGIGLIEKVLD